ncbi:MAG: hypothetical protein AAGF30_16470, partial [Pseudomonadota bacterium]
MTDAPLTAPSASLGRTGKLGSMLRGLTAKVVPVLTIVAALMALWYLACIPMNAQQSLLKAERAEIAVTPATAAERRDMGGFALAASNPGQAIARAYAQERPRLPAP